MITAQPTLYAYSMKIKLSSVQAPTASLFPSAEDMVLSSRKFDALENAISSANVLVSGIMNTLNTNTPEKYKMVTEVNPKFSGSEAISEDWAPNEVAKLWIYNRAEYDTRKTGKILAIGLAQLIEVTGDPVFLN